MRQGGGADNPPGVKWFRGAPVSIREGMEGKTLRYVQGVGAVIMEKKDLPASNEMKLSWTPETGRCSCQWQTLQNAHLGRHRAGTFNRFCWFASKTSPQVIHT